MNYLLHPVVSSLIVFLSWFPEFANNVINHFVMIPYNLHLLYHYYSFSIFFNSVSRCVLTVEWVTASLLTSLSIVAELDNAVVRMVFTRSLISKSSSPLVAVPRAHISIGIIVTFMFYGCYFLNSQVTSKYLCLFSLSFNFTLWSAGTTKSTNRQVLILFFGGGGNYY